MSHAIAQRLNAVATAENARAWEKTSEKYTFAIDLLEVSAHQPDADRWVDKLEDKFEALLSQAVADSDGKARIAART